MDVEQVLHVNVGEGDMSYANKSLPQRSIILKTKPLIEEAVTTLFSKSNPEKLNIADLGCSSGPNALSAVTLILDAVREQGCFWPEIQVFLNDLLGNDFNTVFGTVPSSDKKVEMGLRHASHLQRLDHSTSGFSLAKACTFSTLLPASTGSLRYFLREMLHCESMLLASHFGQALMDKLFEKVEETMAKNQSFKREFLVMFLTRKYGANSKFVPQLSPINSVEFVPDFTIKKICLLKYKMKL